MTDERRSSRFVFLGAEQKDAALFEEVENDYRDATYFPLNQKAAAPFLRAGRNLSLPPFWNLLSGREIEQIDQEADAFASTWRQDNYRRDALRAWIWAREFAYISRLLARLEDRIDSNIQYLVRRTAKQCRDWHGASMTLQAVMEEWAESGRSVIWISEHDVANTLSPAPPSTLLLAETETPPSPWILFSSFGIPDLSFHLRSIIAQGVGSIVLLLDPYESGPLPLIYEQVAAANGQIKILGAIKHLTRRSGSIIQYPPESGVLGKWISGTSVDLREASVRLEKLFSRSPPVLCVVSDHDCPQTVLLGALCMRRQVPLLAIPHSSWPMEEPFLARPPAGYAKWTYAVATRRAVRRLSEKVGSEVSVSERTLPSPRYRISLRRLLRVVTKWLVGSETTLRIGIVVTSGEAIVAPDVPIYRIGASLRSLLDVPPEIRRRLKFHIRLRDAEDEMAVLTLLAREAKASGRASVIWEKSGDRIPADFLREMSLIVEIGTPGSIMLESFAEMVPFVRMGARGRRRTSFVLHPLLVPRLSAKRPWSKLAPFVRGRWRRKLLALCQLVFLIKETSLTLDWRTTHEKHS